MKPFSNQVPPSRCQSCGYDSGDLISVATDREDWPTKYMWACRLCVGSTAINAKERPHLHPDGDVLAAICYVGNAIMAEIRKGREPKC